MRAPIDIKKEQNNLFKNFSELVIAKNSIAKVIAIFLLLIVVLFNVMQHNLDNQRPQLLFIKFQLNPFADFSL